MSTLHFHLKGCRGVCVGRIRYVRVLCSTSPGARHTAGSQPPTGQPIGVEAVGANPVYRKIRIKVLQRKRKANTNQPDQPSPSASSPPQHASPGDATENDAEPHAAGAHGDSSDDGQLPPLTSHNRVYRLIRIKELQHKFRQEQQAKLPARIRRRLGLPPPTRTRVSESNAAETLSFEPGPATTDPSSPTPHTPGISMPSPLSQQPVSFTHPEVDTYPHPAPAHQFQENSGYQNLKVSEHPPPQPTSNHPTTPQSSSTSPLPPLPATQHQPTPPPVPVKLTLQRQPLRPEQTPPPSPTPSTPNLSSTSNSTQQAPSTQQPPSTRPDLTNPSTQQPPSTRPDLTTLNSVQRLIRRKKIEHRRRAENKELPGQGPHQHHLQRPSTPSGPRRPEGRQFVDIFAYNLPPPAPLSEAENIEDAAVYASTQEQFPDLDVLRLATQFRPTPAQRARAAATAAAAAAADDSPSAHRARTRAVAAAAAAHPSATPLPASDIRAQLTYDVALIMKGLTKLGVSAKRAARLVSADRFYDFVDVSSPELVVERLGSLAEILGVSPNQAAEVAMRQPNLLRRHPEALRGNLGVLGGVLGVNGGQAAAAVCKCPVLLDMGGKTLVGRVRLVGRVLGVEDTRARALAKSFPQLLSLTPKYISNKIASLASALDIPRDRVVAMVLSAPTLVALSLPNITSKWGRLQALANFSPRWGEALKNMAPSAAARCCMASHEALDRLEYVVQFGGEQKAGGKARAMLGPSTLLAMSQAKFIDRYPDYMFWMRMRRAGGTALGGLSSILDAGA